MNDVFRELWQTQIKEFHNLRHFQGHVQMDGEDAVDFAIGKLGALRIEMRSQGTAVSYKDYYDSPPKFIENQHCSEDSLTKALSFLGPQVLSGISNNLNKIEGI